MLICSAHFPQFALTISVSKKKNFRIGDLRRSEMNSQHENCSCHLTSTGSQNLDEMEFERGIWSAAVNGDVEKIRHLLSRSNNSAANDKDSAGEPRRG